VKSARGRWVFRRFRHTASAYNGGSDSLLITHPFPPLSGQRVAILFERTYKDESRGRVYVCEGCPAGTVALPEHFTDRGAPAAARPLTFDVLLELAAVVSALMGRLTDEKERTNLVSR